MPKKLKNLFFAVMCMLFISICANSDYVKADDKFEGGVTEYGDFVFSPTLMARCNLKDKIDQDCIKRLAYDHVTNASQHEMFRDFRDEKETIIDEYNSAYLDLAVGKVVDSGNQEDELSKKTCVDTSGEGCDNVGSDTLTGIRFNNNVSVNTTKLLSDINTLLSSDATSMAMEHLLESIVPETEVDTADTSLASPSQ